MDKTNKIVDSWLVLNYQSGHKKSLAILVKRWHAKFCKQAFYYTKDIDVAKDIAQESWRVIINKVHTLKETNKFGSWGLAIVTRKSIDWLRKEQRDFNNLKEYYESARAINNSDILDLTEGQKLKQAIEALSNGQKIVIRLFYLEAYSISEICEILNLSKGTVKSRLFYAREKLKTIIKHRNYEPSESKADY